MNGNKWNAVDVCRSLVEVAHQLPPLDGVREKDFTLLYFFCNIAIENIGTSCSRGEWANLYVQLPDDISLSTSLRHSMTLDEGQSDPLFTESGVPYTLQSCWKSLWFRDNPKSVTFIKIKSQVWMETNPRFYGWNPNFCWLNHIKFIIVHGYITILENGHFPISPL